MPPGEVDEESEDLGDDPEDEWTLRKYSADDFTNVYHRPVFEIIVSSSGPAAVLTLGGHRRVAEGAPHDGRHRGILCRMLDYNKVQKAAASAFASLEEKSEANVVLYCEPILRQFVQCFRKYQDRNILRSIELSPPRMPGVCRDRVRGRFPPICAPALPSVHLREPAGIGGCREQQGLEELDTS
ncbi:hypothetical protein V8E54_015019 [Elaphomyces granulatus]